MAIGQTDGVENGKNFYLYKPPGKPFQMVLHDFDFTLGMKCYNLTSAHTIWNFPRERDRPLYTKTIPDWHQEMKEAWSIFLVQFDLGGFQNSLNLSFPTADWQQRMIFFRDLLSKPVQMDKWHRVDYGWQYDEFMQKSLISGFGRTGVPPSTPCTAKTSCLWIEGMIGFVARQRIQILNHLDDK